MSYKSTNSRLVELIDLSSVEDNRGTLVFMEAQNEIPFEIQRTYFIIDVPPGVMRAGHAHKLLRQVIVAVKGTIKILLKNEFEEEIVLLDNPQSGLFVKPMTWLLLEEFSKDSVCLVLADRKYEPHNCYRDFDKYLKEL